MWISFVVAAFIAAFTGFSYAELAGMFPRNAAEYVYTKNAFRNNSLAFIAQWIMLFTLIVSAATVALGFGGYFSVLTGVQPPVAAAALIAVLSVINYRGIRLSTRFNTFSTITEISGLVLVVVAGTFFIGKTKVDMFYSPSGMQGIFSAASLIFFAYIGFEEIVNLSEDTKKARNIVPKALVISLAISTLFYILVSLSSVSILGADRLGASKAPLADVISAVFPSGGLLMSLIALFATANTVMVIMLVASRMIYGLARNNSMPAVLGRIGPTGTPHVSIAVVLMFSLLSLLFGGIKTIALLTDLGIFTVYILINLSLIILRYKKPAIKGTFRSPLNFGRFPVLALFGILSSAYMLTHFPAELFVIESGIILVGLVLYKSFRKVVATKRKFYADLFRKSLDAISGADLFKETLKYPMEVSSIMIRDVKTVSPRDNVKKIVGIMNRHRLGSLVVIENDKPTGIITERDILRKVVSKNLVPEDVTAQDIMTKSLATVNPADSVVDAIELMASRNIKKLPVVDNGELVGIITASDILKSGEEIEYAVLKKLAKFLPVSRTAAAG